MRKITPLLVMLACCKRETNAGPPPPSSSAPSLPSVAASSSVPNAAASSAPEPDVPAKRVATQWNDALNAHDAATLRSLHGPSVKFYGAVVDRATYERKIQQALAKDPDYHQDISFTNVEWQGKTAVKVSFRKKDKRREYPSYLVVESIDGVWVITEESDLVTDAAMACLSDKTPVTLTGRFENLEFFAGEHLEAATVLRLDRAVCAVVPGPMETKPVRVDGVTTMHAANVHGEKWPMGKKVTVTGTIHRRETWHYATDVVLAVDTVK